MKTRELKKGILLPLVLSFFFILATSCSHLLYYPDHYLHFPPSQFGLQYQEVSFQANDGQKLFGWFFPATQQKKAPLGTLIQFHGNAQNMSSHYASLAWIASKGYNLFVFSYRGYGQSDGSPSQKGTYLDGLAAIHQAWILHQQSHASQFVIYGESLGGAIAMRALADSEHQSSVSLIVMDSTFLSYRRIAFQTLQRHWLTWLISPLSWILVSDEYSAEEALKQNQVPLLVIHDEKDPIVPFVSGEEIYEKAQGKKEFWKLDQGLHVGTFSIQQPKLRERFLDFLQSLNH